MQQYRSSAKFASNDIFSSRNNVRAPVQIIHHVDFLAIFQATDRLKSEQELAKEEQERLRKLEVSYLLMNQGCITTIKLLISQDSTLILHIAEKTKILSSVRL